ncbi:MAG: hypothetical protein KC620_23705, partial [Myxococcales bacterium]|nr:hypothetical protein [Myxococcales bacterium]
MAEITPWGDAWAQRPVILLTFANDHSGGEHGQGYLRNLRAEMKDITAALERASDEYEIVVDFFIEASGLFDLFARYHDRIVAFHYGGHAQGDALMLEDADGRPSAALAEGLAGRLGMLPNLSLVFLNGCTTRPHVTALQVGCQAPIIATERAIVDAVATQFARRFYRDLARGLTVGDAFQSAELEVRTQLRRPGEAWRMLLPVQAAPATEWPWGLHLHTQNPRGTDWRLHRRRAPWSRLAVGAVGGLAVAGLIGATLMAAGMISQPTPPSGRPPDAAPPTMDPGGGARGMSPPAAGDAAPPPVPD